MRSINYLTPYEKAQLVTLSITTPRPTESQLADIANDFQLNVAEVSDFFTLQEELAESDDEVHSWDAMADYEIAEINQSMRNLTESDFTLLNQYFEEDDDPSYERLDELAQKLGVTADTIDEWHRARRLGYRQIIGAPQTKAESMDTDDQDYFPFSVSLVAKGRIRSVPEYSTSASPRPGTSLQRPMNTMMPGFSNQNRSQSQQNQIPMSLGPHPGCSTQRNPSDLKTIKVFSDEEVARLYQHLDRNPNPTSRDYIGMAAEFNTTVGVIQEWFANQVESQSSSDDEYEHLSDFEEYPHLVTEDDPMQEDRVIPFKTVAHLTQSELARLRRVFEKKPRPTPAEGADIASDFGVDAEDLATWYHEQQIEMETIRLNQRKQIKRKRVEEDNAEHGQPPPKQASTSVRANHSDGVDDEWNAIKSVSTTNRTNDRGEARIESQEIKNVYQFLRPYNGHMDALPSTESNSQKQSQLDKELSEAKKEAEELKKAYEAMEKRLREAEKQNEEHEKMDED